MTLNIEGKGETGVAITLDVPKNDESWDNFDERNVILYDSNKLKIKTVEEKKLTEVINISEQIYIRFGRRKVLSELKKKVNTMQ